MNCKQCRNHVSLLYGEEDGDAFTKIDIDCPICGNDDTLYVWGEVLIEEVELEINQYYKPTY